MRKSDLKIDFSKRDVISTVCLTVVLVIVLVLGNSFGYVSAEVVIDDNYVSSGWGDAYESDLNYPDYTESSIYDSNVDTYHLAFNYNQDLDFFSLRDVMSSNMPSEYRDAIVEHPIEPDLGSYTSYLAVPTSYNSVKLYLFPSSQCYFAFNTVWIDYNSWNYNDVPWLEVDFSFDNSGNLLSSGGRYYYMNNPRTSGGYLLFGSIGNDAITNVAFCNFPILGVYNDYAYDFNMESQISGYLNGENNCYTNINYLISDGNYSGLGSVNGGSESARNNLYMNNPQWSFNQPTNCNLLLNNDGKSVFTANSTSYQNENQNQFSIHYDFEIVVKYDYDSASGGFGGGGHGFLLNNNVSRSFRDPNNLLIGDTIKSRTGTFKYYDFNNSLSYWNQTFQQFYETGSSKSFSNILTTPQIFNSCYLVNGSGTAYNDQTFFQWWTLAQSNGPIVFDGTISGTSKVKITSLIMYCNAVLVDSSSASSGNCKYYYNFLTGESGVVDNGMATNNYPYNYESSDTGYNSAYGTSGYMVQNNNQSNNQTVNVTNNVSSDVQNEISNIITGVDDSSESNWVSTLQTLLQANTFITFMASTFAFMPSSFWTALSTFFITCLAFLTGFVLLRVLLDLL